MKTKLTQLATLTLLLAILNSHHSTAHAQGVLTPPGAPAPTMKSLDQIEARTPISTPYTISTPGSYYLTTNVLVAIHDGIIIAANNVTLDLNGFTISSIESTASTGCGIKVGTSGSGAVKNVTIMNGFISSGVTNNNGTYAGSGFGYGIYNLALPSRNVHVSGVTVTGCRFTGIFLGTANNNTLVESCIVDTVGSYGIYAGVVHDSSVFNCGGTGINADQIVNCRCDSPNASYALYASSVYNSVGTSTGGYGIYATTAQNCVGTSTANYGLYASSSAENCSGQSYNGQGLYSVSAINCTGTSTYQLGLGATLANNCSGTSFYNTGLGASAAIGCRGGNKIASFAALNAFTAAFCIGDNGYATTAISANIANGCFDYDGTNAVTYKYNMP